MVYIPECKQQLRNYEIIHVDTCTRSHTLNLGCSVINLREPRNIIINNLDVILHGFMLQIFYTLVFRVKRLNNRTGSVRFNSENRGINNT